MCMKKSIFLIAIMMASVTVMAQQRSAKAISNIVAGCSKRVNTLGMQLRVMSSDVVKNVKASDEAFAVYAAEERPGFVIVSTDERMPEVLAISDTETFDTMDGKNEALVTLLNNYAEAHRLISEGKATAEHIFGRSANIITDVDTQTKEPLLGAIAYAQDTPYNRKTPMIGGNHTPTGCVATAAAMVMKYYEYPKVGNGSVSYTTDTNKLPVSFDFSATPFDWSNILDTYPGLVDLPETKITYSDDRVLAFDQGTFEFDPNRPRAIKLAEIYNFSNSMVSGKLMFMVENANRTVRRIASAPHNVKDLKSKYGWKYIYIEPNLPSDLPDGDYLLYAAFTKDDAKYTYAKRSSRLGAENYSVKVTKTGNIFTWQDNEFMCTVSAEKADAVATLMAACGAACQADYMASETGASTFDVYSAFNTYFGYDNDAYELSNEYTPLTDMYKEAKGMLDAGHIVPVSGHTVKDKDGKTYGHSYLIDGYDMTGEQPMFHINWGWNGSANGYFLLTQMQPSEAGTGGSTSSYSGSYNLYMNVYPDNNVNEGLLLTCTELKASPELVSPNSIIMITATQLANHNLSKEIVGTFYWYLVDEMGKAYKCGEFYTRTDAQKPGHYRTTPVAKTVIVPSDVPNGAYTLELRVSENDHFVCLNGQTVTMAGSFTAINEVETESNAGKVYDLTGKVVSDSHRGIQIRNGVKEIKK